MSTSSAWIDPSVLPAFLLAVVVLVLAPGPDMAFIVATGLREGRRGAARAVLGITTGVGVYVVLTVLGIGVFIAAAPGLIEVIQLAGAGYLAYLAWSTWKNSGGPLEASSDRPTHVFRRGFVVNISNPKVILFFTALLPQFLGDATEHPILQLLMLGLVLQAVGMLGDLAIGCAAGTFRDRVLHRSGVRKALDRLAAGVYGTLAGFLLVDAVR